MASPTTTDEVSAKPRVIVIHSSDELYGADRILLQVLAAYRDLLHADVEVWLPVDVDHGAFPLCERLTELGFRWEHRRVPVLRQVNRGPRGAARLLLSSWSVWRALRSRRPTMVHLASSACLLAAPVAWAARVPGRTVHVQERWTGTSSHVLRFLAKWTTLRIAISDYVAQASGLRRPAPVVVLNSVDDAQRRVPLHPPSSASTLHFVVASRWNRWKGHRTLVDAWQMAGCPGRLTILGGPPPTGDGVDVRQLVHDIVGDAGTIDIVGEVRDAAPYIAGADVLILPSDEPEPFGLVVLEAFSLSRPVIASRDGGPLEIIEEGQTGWLFDRADSAALAELLQSLTKTVASDAGHRARAVYTERFGPDRYRQRIADVVTAAGVGHPVHRRRRVWCRERG